MRNDPRNAARWSYRPDETALFHEAGAFRKRHDVAPAGSDRAKVHLLLIDVQRDFCFPEGSLFVGGRSGRGAIEDNDRIARFVYKNLSVLTETTCTLDTHFPFQIFFPSFWQDEAGAPLSAHREITTDDIRQGGVRPNPAVAPQLCGGNYSWLLSQVTYYCEELEKAGKYKLYLWPQHCLLGGEGHVLSGVVHEARLFHAYVRGAKASIEVKGGNALTENYSVLAPEVLTRHDGRPLAQKNTAFVKTLLAADAVVIAGQAASHCVKSSIEDLLGEIKAQDAGLVKKVYILEDCMSAVAVPDPSRREDGSTLFSGDPDPRLDFRLSSDATYVAKRGDVVILSRDGSRRSLAIDTVDGEPAFDVNERHVYLLRGGRLVRNGGLLGEEEIGEALEGRTRIWVGPAFGFGLYRAGGLTRGFVFDAERRGYLDVVPFPRLEGPLVSAACRFSNGGEGPAWFVARTSARGRTRTHVVVLGRNGRVVASRTPAS